VVTDRRWDTDSRGVGVGDAAGQLGALDRLREACARPGWVAEDADAHLGPHLRRECAAPGSPWRWLGAEQAADGAYVVDLVHVRPASRPDGVGGRYRDAVALLAAVAENSFAVRRVGTDAVECVTGVLDGDGDFAAHGHVLRLRLSTSDPSGRSPE
jgi:GNAT superfamily N-acetyltransferase